MLATVPGWDALSTYFALPLAGEGANPRLNCGVVATKVVECRFQLFKATEDHLPRFIHAASMNDWF